MFKVANFAVNLYVSARHVYAIYKSFSCGFFRLMTLTFDMFYLKQFSADIGCSF